MHIQNFRRPLTSGRPMPTFRSNRPGLKIAGSRISTRFVAAITMIPLIHTETIHLNQKLVQCLLSFVMAAAHTGTPLRRATASISSINTIHGACFFASSNKSRTREAPTPTNISTKSEPEMLKKRNAGFACNRFCQKGFTGSRRSPPESRPSVYGRPVRYSVSDF